MLRLMSLMILCFSLCFSLKLEANVAHPFSPKSGTEFSSSRASGAKLSVNEITLNNGLKVFLIPDPTASLVTVKTFVKTGSVTEAPYWGSGISHYLEHLLAGGTTAFRTESEYKALIARLGGAFNAYTTYDHTAFFINTTPSHLDEAVQAMYEWMYFSRFSDREFARERDVIIREMEKDEANLDRQFFQDCQENFYSVNPLKFPVIGYLDTFKAVSANDVRAYYKSRYVPANMVLVIGGNISVDSLSASLNATFGSRPPGPILDKPALFESPAIVGREVRKTGNTQSALMSYRFMTVGLNDPDMFPLDLLEYILGEGKQSVLYRLLVEEKKLAYKIDCASYTPEGGTGYFEVSIEADESNKSAIEAALTKVLDALKAGDYVDEGRLSRAKSQKLVENIFSMDSIEDKVARVGTAYVASKDKSYFDFYVQKLKEVSPDQVTSVAKKYLNFETRIVTIMAPQEKTPLVSTQSLSAATPIVPEKITLSNGVRVLLYPDHSLPKIEVNVFLLGGVRSEPPSLNGISRLTANLLGTGSARYDKETIEAMVENRGASMRATSGLNTIYYTLKCLPTDFSSLFPVFSDTFLQPVFLDLPLEEAKRQARQLIATRQDDWFDFSQDRFRNDFFASHPYGRSPLGKLDVVNRLKKEDLSTFYRGLISPNQMVLTVCGDYDRESVMAQITQTFGQVAATTASVSLSPLARASHVKESSQTLNVSQDIGALFIGYDSTTFTDRSDRVKLDVLDAVLSGMSYPGGRLHQLLREKGLVYMVHAANNPGIEQGYFFIYALSTRDKVAEVQKLIRQQIDDIKAGHVTDEEFKEAVCQVDFYYHDRWSTKSELALVMGTDELYQNHFDDYLAIDQRLTRVTKKDVVEMAKKYFKNAQMLVIKGPETGH